MVVTFRNGDEYSPGVYLHWGASDVFNCLIGALPRLRAGDPGYSAARFCGVIHAELSGNTGIGLLNVPTADDIQGGFTEYTHGDGGVIVVDTVTGDVSCHAGYWTDQEHPQNIGALPK